MNFAQQVPLHHASVKLVFTVLVCLFLTGCAQLHKKKPMHTKASLGQTERKLTANQGMLNLDSLAPMQSRLPISEWSLAQRTLLIALMEHGDGDSVPWRNPVAKTLGYIRPISAQVSGHHLCRKFTASLTSDDYVKAWSGAACRDQNKIWSLIKFEPEQEKL